MIYWDTQQAADFDQNQNHISFKTFLAWKTEQPTSQSVFDDSLTGRNWSHKHSYAHNNVLRPNKTLGLNTV